MDKSNIVTFLQNSYWARHRSRDNILASLEQSHCFALFESSNQVAFARVVSDMATFAYLMDVFVNDAYRGRGYGKYLVKHILADTRFATVTTWMLATKDAHGLYQKFGFEPLDNPEKYMIKKTS
jgi:N-acetylglutamate synthase-like GNAT family acetyltransferase